MQKLRYPRVLCFAVCFVVSCSKSSEGPSPSITLPITPGAVCNASNAENATLVTDVRLQAADGSFSPMSVDVLGNARAAMPEVTLVSTGQTLVLTRVTFISTSELKLTLGASEKLAAGTYDVKVRNPNGNQGVVMGALKVVDPPVVTAVKVPTAGSDTICNGIDNTLVIEGTGFRPTDGQVVEVIDAAGAVVLTGAASDIQVIDATKVTLKIAGASPGKLAPGKYGVRVTGTEGPPACTGTKQAVLTVVPPPTITSVAPTSTCTEVVSSFKIVGTGFRTGATVTFGTTEAKVTFVSDTELTASFDAKSLPAGTVDVTVSNPEVGDGGKKCFSVATTKVTVFGPPTLVSITPASLCSGGGQSVVATGTGFHGDMKIVVGTSPAPRVTVSSDTSLSFEAPPLPATGSPYDVRVEIPEGCGFTLPKALTIVPGPRMDSLDPTRGWIGIDNPITVYGEALPAGATLSLKGASATAADLALVDTVISTPQIVRATIPGGGKAGGPYDLVLKTPSGCGAVLAKAFTLDADPSLTITKVVPPFGWKGEKTPITIVGDKFISTPRAFVVIPTATPKSTALKATAFVSPQSLTSIVPAGLAPTSIGNEYDINVINPDGGGGKLAKAFRVVDKPIPTISNVSPAAGTTGGNTVVAITGCNFRSPKVELVSSTGTLSAQTAGTLTCTGAATCPGGTSVCTLAATLNPGGSLATGAYVIRVTNPDEATYGEYSAFVITNPSSKLEEGFKNAKPLNVGRRSLTSTNGRIDSASRFLYALAGEQADGTVLDSVEVAPLDLFGTLGNWYIQRNRFVAPRAGHTTIELGSYVYVLGGTSTKGGTGGASPTGTPLDTIERARILDLTDQVQVDDPATGLVGSLAKGSWYYVVSAVKDASDGDNPSGEALPSDEVVVSLGLNGNVGLTWKPIPGATRYRIYRTEKVNGTSQSEVFLKEVTALTYTDTGVDVVDTTRTPLRRGSTGVWVTLPVKLARARFNAASTMALDASGQKRVYVIGGHGSCAGGAAATMRCWESATISADGKTLDAFAAGSTNMAVARERFGSGTMSKDNGPTGYSGSQNFVFASGGLGVSGPAASFEYASVDAGGLLTWKTVADFSPKQKDGSALGVANGFCFAFGGGSTGSYTASVKRGGLAAITGATMTLGWSDAVANLPVPAGASGLGRFGFTLESAFFYVVGGTTNDTDAVSLVSQIIY